MFIQHINKSIQTFIIPQYYSVKNLPHSTYLFNTKAILWSFLYSVAEFQFLHFE